MKQLQLITLAVLPAVAMAQLADGQGLVAFHRPLDELSVTSPYGRRLHPVHRRWHFHAGIDLAARSSPVYAMLSGRVQAAGFNESLGHFVRTAHLDNRLILTYAHLSTYHVQAGDWVSAGDILGTTGMTGRTTGEHLHLAVTLDGQPVNPLELMADIILHNAISP